MAIRVRRGNKIDFDPNKLLSGEPSAPLDSKELFIAFGPGDVKKIATYEDMVTNIENATTEIIADFTSGANASANVIDGVLDGINHLIDDVSSKYYKMGSANGELYLEEIAPDPTPPVSETILDDVGGLRGRIDGIDLQLDIVENKSAIDVYSYGDETTIDWKNAIALAATAAANNGVNAIKFRKGIFRTSEDLPEDVHVFGAGMGETYIDFDITSGNAIRLKRYNVRPIKIYDLTLRNLNPTNDVGGIYVSNDDIYWGTGADVRNVELINFKTFAIKLRGAYNAIFDHVTTYNDPINGLYINTILDIGGIDTSSFSNQIMFNQCVFHRGHIAYKNNRGSGITFNICTFEDLDLLGNIESIDVSPWTFFIGCHLEKVRKVFVNAKMDEVTLLPILPLTNHASMGFIKMQDCLPIAFVPEYAFDSTVEPINYKYFTYDKGLSFDVSGTFTPECSATLVSGTFSYTFRVGNYRRLGDRIDFDIKIVVGTMTGAEGRLQITGLPFVSNGEYFVSVTSSGLTWNGTMPIGIVQHDTNTVNIYGSSSNEIFNSADASTFGAGDIIYVYGNYKTYSN
jgi:hypothetical protein